MKKALRSLVLVLPLFALMACERVSFDSTLDVFSPLIIKGKKDSVTLNAGKMEAQFIVKGKKNFELKVEGDNAQEIKFPIPSSVILPRQNGHISITADQLEQAFDLEGTIQTGIDNGPSRTITEDCSVKTGTRRVCRMEPGPVVCHVVNGQQICNSTGMHEVCYYEDVFSNGTREVTYHFQTSQTALDLEFKAPGTTTVLAQLKGKSDVNTSKIIERESACRIFGHFPY